MKTEPVSDLTIRDVVRQVRVVCRKNDPDAAVDLLVDLANSEAISKDRRRAAQILLNDYVHLTDTGGLDPRLAIRTILSK